MNPIINPNKLLTDQLEKQFGSVFAQIIDQSPNKRIINILDAKQTPIVRAVTLYSSNHSSEKQKIILEIESGALLGKTARKYDFELEKTAFYEKKVLLNKKIRIFFNTNYSISFFRSYNLFLKNSKLRFEFGRVIELITPNYVSLHNRSVGCFEKLQKEELKLLFH